MAGPLRRPRASRASRGRPRDPGTDAAVLSVALELLREGGYEAVSLPKVAQRAGVSKPTVYRRWPDRAHLVVEAMVRRQPLVQAPDTGDTRTDLVAHVRGLVAMFTRTPAGQVLPGLVAAMAGDPELARAYRSLLLEPRRAQVRDAVLRGIARGDLAAGTDAEYVVDVLAAPIYLRLLLTGAELDDAYAERAVDLVLAAYSAPRANP